MPGIASVDDLIIRVKAEYKCWGTRVPPWFRGEPRETPTPLLPSLFREPHNENRLLQEFRAKAPLLTPIPIPRRDHTDQWLFLAQHVRLPTRLLDWTQGLLIALFFAIQDPDKGARVWMLHPTRLNRLSSRDLNPESAGFPLTWIVPGLDTGHWMRAVLAPDDQTPRRPSSGLSRILTRLGSYRPKHNLGSINVRLAWEPAAKEKRIGTQQPVAIQPTYIHPRLQSQQGCFTIFGLDELPLPSQLAEDEQPSILRSYDIDERCLPQIETELHMMGVSRSALFPDLDNLAKELGRAY